MRDGARPFAPAPRMGVGRAGATAAACGRSRRRSRAQPREHGPLRGRFRRVVTIHDLIYRDRTRRRISGSGRSGCGCSFRRPPVARTGSSFRLESTPHDLERFLAVAAAKVDVVPEGVAPRVAGCRREDELRARYGLGDRPSCSRVGEAAAQEPDSPSRRACARAAGARPVLVLPGYPTPARGGAARACGGRRRGGDTRFLGWISPSRPRGLLRARRRVRLPLALRGLRAAGARGDGARRAGRLLRPRIAPGGRGRRRAALRPRAAAGDRAGDRDARDRSG